MINSNELALIQTFHNLEGDPKTYANDIQFMKNNLPDSPMRDYIEAKTSLEALRAQFTSENPKSGSVPLRERQTLQNTFFNQHREEFERIDALFERIQHHDYGMTYANQKEYFDILRETYFEAGATVGVVMSQDYEKLRQRYEDLATQGFPAALYGAAKLSFDLNEQNRSIQQYTEASAQGYKTGQVGIYYLQHILGELANTNPRGPDYFEADHFKQGQQAIDDLVDAIRAGDIEAIAFGQRYLDDKDKALRAKDDPNVSDSQRKFASTIVDSCNRIEQALLDIGAMMKSSSAPVVGMNYTDHLIHHLKHLSHTSTPEKFNFPIGFDLNGSRTELIEAIRQNDPDAIAKANEFITAYEQFATLDRKNLSEAQNNFLDEADKLNKQIHKAYNDNQEKGFMQKSDDLKLIANPNFRVFTESSQTKLMSQAQDLQCRVILQNLLSEVEQMVDLFRQKTSELADKSERNSFDGNKYAVMTDTLNNLQVLHSSLKVQVEKDPYITKHDVENRCDQLNMISDTCQGEMNRHQIKSDLKQRFFDKVKEIVHNIKEKLGFEPNKPVYSTVKTAETLKQSSEKLTQDTTPSMKR